MSEQTTDLIEDLVTVGKAIDRYLEQIPHNPAITDRMDLTLGNALVEVGNALQAAVIDRS
ncbi:hypothetical protein [Actinokineospora sp. NBRC 105648]|uniref:hypothetical protein n=1 Tax=Actinokineospora sp. NBRC 105648 TaxID=3032206 RepID=UPI0024A2A18A|nr:hypothetical protein [Actinokineospora sp. NBRC 105648]GLZ42416.1 hypothetical protein Acsp05_60400 [Actinokineospora sp. NBRC 105648]